MLQDQSRIFSTPYAASGLIAGLLPRDVSPVGDHGERRASTDGTFFDNKGRAISLEFTRDPAPLHDYLSIYAKEFRITHNVPCYHSIPDEHDRRGFTLIVRQGETCVGGARLSVRSAGDRFPLPIEMDGFALEDHFPHLKGRRLTYGQIGRLCLLPEFRGGLVTRAMFRYLHEQVNLLEVAEVFGTATATMARLHSQTLTGIGLRDVTIRCDIKLPSYPMCAGTQFLLLHGINGAVTQNLHAPMACEAA